MAIQPLELGPRLQEDLRQMVDSGGTEAALALQSFVAYVWGHKDGSRGPKYMDNARTVWRVEGNGNPRPEIDFFDWGGSNLGVPELRVWYLRQGTMSPVGIGAFEARGASNYQESSEILSRVREMLHAPDCWFERVRRFERREKS